MRLQIMGKQIRTLFSADILPQIPQGDAQMWIQLVIKA